MSAARSRGSLVAAAFGLAAFTATSAARAQAVEIDGIIALVGSAPGDEGAATPLLASDVALHEALSALLAGSAAAGASLRGAKIAPARRQAILLALLVRDAHLSGEEIDPAVRQEIVEAVTANAGGPESFAALLASLGASEGDAGAWAGDVAIAAAQLTYMREQIEPPSDKDVQRRHAAQDHPFAGRPLKDVKGRLRELMIAEQLAAALAAELAAALADGTVRFVRP